MCTKEEVNIGITTPENALMDKRNGEYVGDYHKWIAEPENNIDHLELVRLSRLNAPDSGSAGAQLVNFNFEELNLIREWINCIQDVHPKYFEDADFNLAIKVIDAHDNMMPK